MKAVRHTVSRGEDRMLLQEFLAARHGVSRRAAKNLLDQHNVMVAGKRVWMARHALRAGDEVDVLLPVATEPAPMRISVLHDDEHYLVADKPAGAISNGPDSVEERLVAQTGHAALAAAHRLDRDTSGCLLFAKSAEALERAENLIRRRQITKVYHAIVAGPLRTESMRVSKPVDGQHAVTLLRTLDANDEASHLAVRIETGRTHQIRKHLVSVGHPVLGDRQYGFTEGLAERYFKVPRQMLHAAALEFIHPYRDKPLRVEAPLPRDFRTCLRAFRLT